MVKLSYKYQQLYFCVRPSFCWTFSLHITVGLKYRLCYFRMEGWVALSFVRFVCVKEYFFCPSSTGRTAKKEKNGMMPNLNCDSAFCIKTWIFGKRQWNKKGETVWNFQNILATVTSTNTNFSLANNLASEIAKRKMKYKKRITVKRVIFQYIL